MVEGISNKYLLFDMDGIAVEEKNIIKNRNVNGCIILII